VKEADTPEPPQEELADPPSLAETCMRELVGRASFGHIRCVLRPVLRCVKIRLNETFGSRRIYWDTVSALIN
jgi:hypothetical protein